MKNNQLQDDEPLNHSTPSNLKNTISFNSNMDFSVEQLSFILNIGDMLSTKNGYQSAIKKALSISLKATQSTKGCIYLKNKKNKMSYKTSIGFSEEQKELLKDFCKHQRLLNHILNIKKIVTIPLMEKNDIFSDKILQKLKISAGMFIPILTKDQEGVIFVDGNHHLLNEVSLSTYEQVAMQIGQMISFIKRYQIVSASEKRYRSLMENASCSMFIADLDGNLLETNKEGEKLTGCKKSELIGKKVKDFLTPDFKKLLVEWMKELKTTHYITLTAIQIKRADGTIRTVEGSVVLVDVGNETLFLMIGTDVTEVNFLRGKALLNDKLATIGLLAAGVAHEINNPVAWIISNFDLLKDQIVELRGLYNQLSAAVTQKERTTQEELCSLVAQLDHHGRFQMLDEILDESMQGAKRIKSIVDDLRNYSRPDSGCYESIDLHKVLDSAINMVMSEVKYRAKLVKNYADDLPLMMLNEGKMHQVILNLMVNAAHSLDENKASANEISVSTAVKSDTVFISIKDSGKGIDNDHLKQIFDPFFTTKPIGSGTGLGLFICHEIIRNMGGEIMVESALGKGSTFTVCLPIGNKPQAKVLIS